jgi:putative membrane protein
VAIHPASLHKEKPDPMKKLATQILVNALALSAAAKLVDGIELTGEFWPVMVVALIFSLVNTFVRPVLKLLALPFILLTLGLMLLVINALMLLLTDQLSTELTVDGFGPALLGSIVISVVGLVAGAILDDRKKDK